MDSPTEITSVQLTEILAVLMDIRRLLEKEEHSGEVQEPFPIPRPHTAGLKEENARIGTAIKSHEKKPTSYDPEGECPNCGAEMELRQGKHGAFWGCMAYPECKGTRPA